MRHLLRSSTLRSSSKLWCEENNALPSPARLSIARSYSSKSTPRLMRNQHQPKPLHISRHSAARPVQLLPVCYRRSFINIPNIFTNHNNNNNNNTPQNIRTLRASRTLPFPPSPLYEIIASVESYAEFLPFLTASTVTARDPASGYPSQAFLTVGYGPFTETFTSRVNCDRSKWIVEARSGGGVGDDGQPIPGADEGLFGYLSTKWELVPRPIAVAAASQAGQQQQETEVQLEIRFRFQNPMHTAMMSAVEAQVAGVMIEAFERRIKEQMTLNR